MAGIPGLGTTGIQNNQGLNMLRGAGEIGGAEGTSLQQIKQLFEKLLAKMQEGDQGPQQACKGGNCGGGQGAGGAGGAGSESIEELINKLKKKAEEDPAGFAQALKNPAFFAVAQMALSGGGGGGSVGGVR